MSDPSAVSESTENRRIRVLEDAVALLNFQMRELRARISNLENISQLIRQAGTGGGGGGSTCALFVTSSTISAISGSTFGTGTGTLQSVSGGSYSATGTTGVTLQSYFSTTIASSTLVLALQQADGSWLIDGVSC